MPKQETSRRVIALAAMTADGRIARYLDEPVTWTSHEDKKLFVDVTKRAGVVVVGRQTFETFPKPLPGRLQVVLTSEPERYTDIPGLVEHRRGEPKEVLAELWQRGYTEVVVAGGASVYAAYLRAGVVDELWLTVEPLLFGQGIPLLGERVQDVQLKLLDVVRLNESSIHLRYAVVR